MNKTLISSLLLLIFSSCHKPLKKDDSLKNFIIANSKADSGVLYLNKFDKIKWDKIYIIHAYHNKNNFDDTLKEYASEILDTGIEYREGPTLFALFYKGELVNLTELGSYYYFVDAVKYKGLKTLDYYTKKDAVLSYRYAADAHWKSFKPYYKSITKKGPDVIN